MRTSWRFVFAAGSLFTALAWLPAGNGDKDKSRPGGKPLKVVLESKGYVIPVHTVQVAPEVSGRVFQLNFEEGTQVKKGDVLAQLDPARFEIETKRALAVVERARALFQQRSNGYRPALQRIPEKPPKFVAGPSAF